MAGILENPPVLQQPFAYNGDKNTIPLDATGDQRASLQEGFPAITSTPITQGGIPPERKDFNGLGYTLSSLYFYLQNGGKFTFNQDVSNAIGGYPAGAILTYTDSSTNISYNVVSLINNNTFNFVAEPSYIDGVKWAKTYTDDLSGYATTDLSNITAEAKDLIAGLGMPSDQYIDIDRTGDGFEYITPANGEICAGCLTNNSYIVATVNTTDTSNVSNAIASCERYATANSSVQEAKALSLNVKKGEKINFFYNASTIYHMRFFYAEGSKE